MNFITMHKQRRYMLLACAAGFFAVFLPWIDFVMVNQNGLHGTGIITFFSFVVCGFIAYIGEHSEALDHIKRKISLLVAVIALVMMIIYYLEAKNPVLRELGYGFYISFLALIAVIGSALLYKN